MQFPVLKKKHDLPYEVHGVNGVDAVHVVNAVHDVCEVDEVDEVREFSEVSEVADVSKVHGQTYSEVLHVHPPCVKKNEEIVSTVVGMNESELMRTYLHISSTFEENMKMRYLLWKMSKQSFVVCENFRVISEVAIFQAKSIEEKDKKIADLEEKLRETKKRALEVKACQVKKRRCDMEELERKREMAELDLDYLKSEFQETNHAVSKIVEDLQSIGKKMKMVLAD
jgi:hypothetical protein